MNFIKSQRYRIMSIFVILIISYLGYFYIAKPEIESRKIIPDSITVEEKIKTIPLGLDLVGGSQLVYDADISEIKEIEVEGSMDS